MATLHPFYFKSLWCSIQGLRCFQPSASLPYAWFRAIFKFLYQALVYAMLLLVFKLRYLHIWPPFLFFNPRFQLDPLGVWGLRPFYAINEILSIRRLSPWNASQLSMTRCVTLPQSVIAVMPQFAMQTSRLPIHICNNIERMCREFASGSVSA